MSPVVISISLPGAPVPVNSSASLSARFTDENPGDTHTASIDWEGASSTGIVMEPTATEAGVVTGSHTYTIPGVYTINVSVTDAGLSGSRSSVLDIPAYIVVYDPAGGFVTGGGWINSPTGACRLSTCAADGSTVGKASFGFVSRYKPGATPPSGNTEFQLKAGGLHFKSSAYQWLVVAGKRAQYKGDGAHDGRAAGQISRNGAQGLAVGRRSFGELEQLKLRDHSWDLPGRRLSETRNLRRPSCDVSDARSFSASPSSHSCSPSSSPSLRPG